MKNKLLKFQDINKYTTLEEIDKEADYYVTNDGLDEFNPGVLIYLEATNKNIFRNIIFNTEYEFLSKRTQELIKNTDPLYIANYFLQRENTK